MLLFGGMMIRTDARLPALPASRGFSFFWNFPPVAEGSVELHTRAHVKPRAQAAQSAVATQNHAVAPLDLSP